MTSEPCLLRNYQIEALNVIDSDLSKCPEVLLSAIMGAGKTVVVARLINKYWFTTERRFLILVNKQELVKQFADTFRKFTDIPAYEISIACASLGDKRNGRLTIATVQTFVGMLPKYPGADLIVLDEAHGAGSVNDGSQYHQIISHIRNSNPSCRLLGLTATPYALGRGYIFGDKVADGIINYFPRVNYSITYDQLLRAGHLAPLKGKVAYAEQLTTDLADVRVNGDYVLDRLGEVMAKEIHLATAREAITAHCGGFKHICVFCCTISHAEQLQKIISEIEPCATIHSQLPPLVRNSEMSRWRSGEVRICTSVNILAEGFDFPALDCLVFARPTLSPRLYLQALGRVLRCHPGKEYGFVLDLTDNTSRFGTDLDRVRVDVPKSVVRDFDKKNDLFKLCPLCARECHKALRVCECGFSWPPPEVIEADTIPEMTEVSFERAPPVELYCDGMSCEVHSAKNEKLLGRVKLFSGTTMVSVWLCFADYYSGFAIQQGMEKWKKLCGMPPYPLSVEEFEERKNELFQPELLFVDRTGKFPELVDFTYEEVPF